VADAHTKQLHAPQLGVAQKLTDAMLARGLYTRVAMDCICLAPPLITDDADLDRIVDIVGESITEVLKAVPQAAVTP
jgi:adenosylmethionine-8-amino-7-oxononanoate aminotransferase